MDTQFQQFGKERKGLMNKCFFAAVSMSFCHLLVAQQIQSAPAMPAGQQTPSSLSSTEKPRVFITDSQSWGMRGSAGGGNGSFGAQSYGGARPQTAEIIKTFGERCPEVIVNDKPEIADYIVELDHEGGKGYLQHKNKVAVFQRVSGDNVMSHSTLSLGGSVKDACTGIVQDWAIHSKEILAATEKPPIPTPAYTPAPPSNVQASISIDSTPAGADINIDGAFVGNTPSTVALAPGIHQVSIMMQGFVNWSRDLKVMGGIIHLNAVLQQVPAKQ